MRGRGEQPQRLPGARPRHLHRHADAVHPKLRSGSFFLDADIEEPCVRPLDGSLVRLVGAVTCEQNEIWQRLRYFPEAKMAKLYDEGRTRGVGGTGDWARTDAETRKMIESGLELADRIGAASNTNRIPSSRTPSRLASDRALHQLSRYNPYS